MLSSIPINIECFYNITGNKLTDLNRTYACQKIAADPVRLNTTKVLCFQNNLYNNVTESCNTDFVNKSVLGVGRKYDTESQKVVTGHLLYL